MGGPELDEQSRLMENTCSQSRMGSPGIPCVKTGKERALFDFLGEKEHLGIPSKGPPGQLAQGSPIR